jgi:MFS family permease
LAASTPHISTDIPFRLDRLPWAKWHWVIVIGLGITWILDGLEVTIVGTIGPTLTSKNGLGLTPEQATAAGSTYLVGACIGALVFGYLTDKLGRKKLFLITLTWYLVSTLLTAFAWDFWSFAMFRMLAGAGIGGEYSAVNSAIDELIPSARRGVADIAINGSWWIGTEVEAEVARETGAELPPPSGRKLTFDASRKHGMLDTVIAMAKTYPQRTVLVMTLMITQAFLYNAVFFTQGLTLTTFFKVAPGDVGWYIIPFAIGNFAGALILGHFFDVVGRRIMISGCYIVSGLLLVLTTVLFLNGSLTATSIALCWSAMFFFASAGASAAYLTVSEIFPLETRAAAIAVVYAVGTLVGGALAPLVYGHLIASKEPRMLAAGWLFGAALMIVGGIVEIILGVDAERKSLEDVAAPLTLAV